jgi:hypothetical protein
MKKSTGVNLAIICVTVVWSHMAIADGPLQIGACCLSNGTCVVSNSLGCFSQGGIYQGDGSSCATAACSGGCCLPDGGCVDGGIAPCLIQQGVFQGFGTSCATHAGQCVGACCAAEGDCSETGEDGCNAGSFAGLGSTCAETECAGACCLEDGGCVETGSVGCDAQGGNYQGDGLTCADVGDQCNGACCENDGLCNQATASTCGGAFFGLGVACIDVNCLGACCAPDGSCQELSFDDCSAINGIFNGEDTTCTDVVCPFPTGFTYQGRLTNDEGAYDGAIDIRFSLWNQSIDGLQFGQDYAANQVDVSNGLFTAYVDFGVEVFNGQASFLQIEIQPVGEAGFETLSPRQPISAVPYALQTRGMFVDDAGSVGIGTTNPVAMLDVVDNGLFAIRGTSGVPGQAAVVGDHTSTATGAGSAGVRGNSHAPFGAGVFGTSTADNGRGVFGVAFSPNGYAAYFEGGRNYFQGDVGIGTVPQAKLDVNGTTRTKVIEIVGGADIAEAYDVAPDGGIKPEAGMVVCIDPANHGALRVSTSEYDRTVAGVISGAGGIRPGLTLSQKGTIADGRFPVANVGRVWCLVDADANGPVIAGDLLTSSNTSGHAMRVTEDGRSNGAILGKAMTSLNQGKGLVLVLVALQ